MKCSLWNHRLATDFKEKTFSLKSALFEMADAEKTTDETTAAAEPPAAPAAEATDKEEVAAEESTAFFEPVIKLEEVEVENGEEEEDVIFKMCVFLLVVRTNCAHVSNSSGERDFSNSASRCWTRAQERKIGSTAALATLDY